MFILMAIISVRIFFNILVGLLIPGLFLGSIFFFASFTSAKIGVVVGGILGLIALYFTSYFLGIFTVFTTGVWTFMFLELRNKKDPVLDQMHEDEQEDEAEDDGAAEDS